MVMIIGQSAKYASFILRSSCCALAPKFSFRHAPCLCLSNSKGQKLKLYDTNFQRRVNGENLIFFPSNSVGRNPFDNNGAISLAYSTDASKEADKQTTFQKMKQMTKDYWHILIPVHLVTSVGWVSIFYTAAKNGVDVVGILESLNLSERYLDMLRGSNAGHWAVAYALYKLFTPIRYTVTLGGTTMSIRYLNKWGYLKFKPRSAIKETQSSRSGTDRRENLDKAGFKNQRQTEPPKT